MRILVCEHFTSEGHANLFVNICRLLVHSGYDVIAVVPQNFTKDLSFCDVKRMDMRYYSDEYPKGSGFKKLLYCLRVQMFMNSLYNTYDIKVTFVVTYDEIALAIGKMVGFVKGTFFVLQHLNTDAISTKKYHRIAYDLIKNRVYIVAFAGFIKDFLVSSLCTDSGRVLVLPHPLNPINNITICDIDCVGLSNSNNEEIIDKIICEEKKNELIKKNNLKVVLKSGKHKFDNGYLKIISGFVDSYIYDDYIARAKCILIPFPENFKYRISGTLIDALSNNKSVIGTNIPVITQSAKIYDKIIKTFNEMTFVSDVIEAGKNNQRKTENFRRFQEQHSDDMITAILTKAIENAIKKKPMEDTYDF